MAAGGMACLLDSFMVEESLSAVSDQEDAGNAGCHMQERLSSSHTIVRDAKKLSGVRQASVQLMRLGAE